MIIFISYVLICTYFQQFTLGLMNWLFQLLKFAVFANLTFHPKLGVRFCNIKLKLSICLKNKCSLNFKKLIEQSEGYLELFWTYIPDFFFCMNSSNIENWLLFTQTLSNVVLIVWGSINDKEIIVNHKYYLTILFAPGTVLGLGKGNRCGSCLPEAQGGWINTGEKNK